MEIERNTFIKIIEQIYLDKHLMAIFVEKFNFTQKEAISYLDEKDFAFIKYLMNIQQEFFYNQISLEKKIYKKEKRLSITEVKKRINDRGYKSNNDIAMMEINKLENIVAKLQRRGKKEQLTDNECLEIVGVIKTVKRKLNPIIKNSKIRK